MKEISSILYESLFYHVQKYNKHSFKPFIVQIILWLDFAFPIKEKDILYQWIMFAYVCAIISLQWNKLQ